MNSICKVAADVSGQQFSQSQHTGPTNQSEPIVS